MGYLVFRMWYFPQAKNYWQVKSMQTQQISQWKGSLNTADNVRQEIADRFGEEEAEKYNPLKNCFTFHTWLSLGYSVKKGLGTHSIH